MTIGTLPLSRFTVLDLTHARAGPTAVRQLADWGANVIKIERRGDDGRDVTGARRDGFDFQNLHRNKRSLTLDLKTKDGLAIFMDLAKDADVVVENFRSTVKHRLGVDYESVKKINPRIVYGSISGFGQTGPYAARPGVDQIAQGMGGLMSITGLPGQGPVRVGIPIDDLCAGILLAQGILMALLERETSGEGQWVHTSLLEAQIFMLDFQGSRWLMAGEVAKQAGNDHPTGIPTGVFPTSDGQINIAASGDHMFRRFCEAADAMSLLDNPDYATGLARSKNRKALNETIGEITKKRPAAYWVELMNEVGRAVRADLHDRSDVRRSAGAASRNGAADRSSKARPAQGGWAGDQHDPHPRTRKAAADTGSRRAYRRDLAGARLQRRKDRRSQSPRRRLTAIRTLEDFVSHLFILARIAVSV